MSGIRMCELPNGLRSSRAAKRSGAVSAGSAG
jgi:hypothetical protein